MITNFSKNIKEPTQLLKDFYNLTSMKICLFDSDGKELCYFPERLSSFCDALRKNKTLDEKCRECDKLAIEKCRKSGNSVIYKCHSGLFEGFAPIIISGEIIGFIAIGQIKSKSSAPTEYIRCNTDLKKEYDKLPEIPEDKIYSALHVVDACARYEELKVFLENNSALPKQQIDSYIEKNIAENIDVTSMAKTLRISRFEIYELCKHYYSTTPAELIKNRRLKKAAELLKNTSLKVSQIAILCGIPDYNYFSKVFKKKYSLSPREYRKEQQ